MSMLMLGDLEGLIAALSLLQGCASVSVQLSVMNHDISLLATSIDSPCSVASRGCFM
jgi:hypothetical protein